MDIFETKIKILIDISKDKNKILEAIYNITENQETFLISNYSAENFKMFFSEMSEEKQKYIDEILEIDNLFQKIFGELDDTFEEQAPKYKELVKCLQKKIKTATELDIKIRAVEQKNRDIIKQIYNKPQLLPSDITKKTMIDKYKKNNKI